MGGKVSMREKIYIYKLMSNLREATREVKGERKRWYTIVSLFVEDLIFN